MKKTFLISMLTLLFMCMASMASALTVIEDTILVLIEGDIVPNTSTTVKLYKLDSGSPVLVREETTSGNYVAFNYLEDGEYLIVPENTACSFDPPNRLYDIPTPMHPVGFDAIETCVAGHQEDTDGDGVGGLCDTCICDNCPNDYNPDQTDIDFDGLGDACDTIINGSYYIHNDSDLTALSGYPEITGSLIIETDVLTSLTGLEALTSVGGNLHIRYSDALTSLTGLENLTSIGGELSIDDNDALTSLTPLSNITSVGVRLRILKNDALTSLTGLENITSLNGALTILDNDALTSLTGLEALTSVNAQLTIEYNDALTSLNALEALTSIGDFFYIRNNNALTSLNGLEALTSVGGTMHIVDNDALTSLTGLEALTSVGGGLEVNKNLEINNNDALTSLSGLYGLQFLGGSLRVYDNTNLCMETAQLLEDHLRLNGYIGTAIISGNSGTICPPEIKNITTNQGADGTYIPLEGIPTFSLPSEKLQWVPSDPDALPEPGDEWSWILGIAHSYISYWTYEMSDYSPEVELTLNYDVTGYFGRWKWFSPAAYLPNDGLFWIRLIAEDADGNRSEVIHQVRVDINDTDGDGKPDAVDNCPCNYNTQQLDADNDGIGDVCDDTPGCGGCGQPDCEPEC